MEGPAPPTFLLPASVNSENCYTIYNRISLSFASPEAADQELTVALDQKIYELRKEKLKQIEALGQQAYPYRYETTHTVPQILDEYSREDRAGAGSRHA